MANYRDFTDLELVALIREDDHSAFQEIYHRYTGTLYTYAYAKLHDREEAKDVVHDIFIFFWQKRHELILHTNAAGYLYQSLRNKTLNIISHKKIELDYISSLGDFLEHDEAATDELVRTRQLKDIIDQEVQKLSPQVRQIFELSRYSNFSHREIANKLGIKEKTVRNKINLALKMLRKELKIIIYLLFLFI